MNSYFAKFYIVTHFVDIVVQCTPHRWCLHLIVVVGFECSRDPESYAGGRVATGRVTNAGQVKG
jgi:hypothetical protein